MQILPLSKAQQRVWLEWKALPNSVAYNNPLFYHLIGDVNVELIKQALQYVVNTQPALRCYFSEQNGVPQQLLLPQVNVELDYQDYTAYLLTDKSRACDLAIANNVNQPFALNQLPLFRFTLIKHAAHEYYFILNIHHIVVDGYSASLLIKTISDYYNQAQLNGVDQTEIYIQQITKPNPDEISNKKFWATQFQDASFITDLYVDSPYPELAHDQGTRQHFSLTPELTLQLKKIAKQNKTTDFIVLMAAFYVVLAKYANQYDLTLGYAIDTRPATCKSLFGFFVNNIPLRLQFEAHETFAEVVQRLTALRKLSRPHQSMDYMDIINSVRTNNPHTPAALYNISFIRANFALSGLNLLGVAVRAAPLFTGAVKDDLCLLYDEDIAFEFEIEYRKNKYHADYIRVLERSYCECLTIISANPNLRIAELNVFPERLPAIQPILPAVSHETLISRFIRHAQQTPHKLALITDNVRSSYHDLYTQVQHVVSYLNSQYLTGQQPVAVLLDRSPTLIITLLALQWLGITYIPLDKQTPAERINTIMAESGASALITNQLVADVSYRCIDILAAEQCQFASIPQPMTAHLAYIIYTSGSTGKPKGVSVSNRAFFHFLANMQTQFMHAENDLLLAITTVAFDIAGLELFLPLWSGTALYLANQNQHKDPFALQQLLSQQPITYLQATPAMWNMLLDIGWTGKNNLTGLCGGEALSTALAGRLLPRVGALWNMYGPTEATIWCAYKQIVNPEQITVGKPIKDLQMLVLDDQLNLLPPCVKGDLYIAGVGLAEGYLNQPDLTAAQFFIHPLWQMRLYRVGDIACQNRAGEFIILGRKDQQIKLNGYRIELGEIEAHIAALSGIRQVAVIVHEQQLLAYIAATASVRSEGIHAQLALALPDYMLPKRYIFLDTLPLSQSGKIDRKSLPRVSLLATNAVELPANDWEEKLLAVWSEILQQHSISVVANFYHCGGHSLLATQIIARLMVDHAIQVDLSTFLTYPTIRSCANYLMSHMLATCMIPKTQASYYPLTEAQKRFWFLTQLHADVGQFNMAGTIQVKDALNQEKLIQALHHLCKQHPVLRTVLCIKDDLPVQTDDHAAALPVEYVNDMASRDQHAYLVTWARSAFILMQTLLWRVIVIPVAANEFVLGLCLHHMISDGHSVYLLLRELLAFYQGVTVMTKSEMTYFDYAAWENNQSTSAAKIAFWQQALIDHQPLQLPTDFSRPERYEYSGQQTHWQLNATNWARVRALCQDLNISVSSYCIGVFALLLQKISSQNDFCLGLPVLNRDHPAVMNMAGCFLNLLPIRIRMPTQTTFRQWLQALHATIQRIITDGNLAFSKLLENVSIARSVNQAPLFSVVINIQHDAFRVDPSDWKIEALHTQTSKYDLSMDLNHSDAGVRGTCEFATHLFKEQTIIDWCEQYQAMLVAMSNQDTEISLITVTSHAQPVLPLKAVNSHPEIELTPFQQIIAQEWMRALNVNKINLQDNFFTLGGHSLLAARLIAAINKVTSISVPLETLFIHAVFEAFCFALETLPKQIANIEPSIIYTKKIALTPNQQQLAFLYLEDSSDRYHLGVLVECPDNIDHEVLHANIQASINQHSIYRWQLMRDTTTAFIAQTSRPSLQVINTLNHAATLATAKHIASEKFDLYQAPLVRFVLFKEPNKHYLLVNMHHLIGDEWSLELLVKEVLLNISPINHEQWHTHSSRWSPPNPVEVSYWQTYLATAVATSIPYTKQYAATLGPAKRKKILLADTIINQCLTISEYYGVSLYLVLLAIYFIFLHYFSGEKQIYLATAYDRRNSLPLQNVHGYLVNLLTMHVDIGVTQSFADLIQVLKQARLHGMQHGDVDFATLHGKGIAPNPHVVFNYQHSYQLDTGLAQPLQWEEILSEHAKFPFVMQLRGRQDNAMECEIEYADNCYHAAFIEQALHAYQSLLILLPSNLTLAINKWQLVEQPAIMVSDYQSHLIANKTLLATLQQISNQYPQQIAIEFDEVRLSYDALWSQVLQVAAAINTIYKDDLHQKTIAIALPNSDRYVIAILAVLMVGATFVPIAINHPHERQQQIIRDSAAALIICDTINNDYAPVPELPFSALLSAAPSPTLVIKSTELNGYIIYTSGTTGVPKGVMIKQEQLQHFIAALQVKLAITANDNILQFSSVSFDASIWEIFLALGTGATLCIPTAKERHVGLILQGFMQKKGITHAILTPSVLQTLDPLTLPALRSVASGGEACTPTLVATWANKVAFFNAYGPTEATVCTNLDRMQRETKANLIGRPFGAAELQVVSMTQQSLPVGAIGELWVAGANVTDGYINQPELNQEKFITSLGKRWYKTGDYVRVLAQQQFEYLGRKDRQIKLRGLRIELAEIEAILQTHTDIQQAVCQVWNEQLLAYVISANKVSSQDVISYLAQHLPGYMIPNHILQIDHLPLLASGKINWQALPTVQPDNLLILPRNEEEIVIQQIWQRYLSVNDLSVDRDFFALGGNSLQAMQIIAGIEARFKIDVAMEWFYSHPTIEKQARLVSLNSVSVDVELEKLIGQLSLEEQRALLEGIRG